MLKLKVVLEKCPEGGYVVSCLRATHRQACPAIPGCHSQGETRTEAIHNIQEARAGCLEVLNENRGGIKQWSIK